ncbi:MAG: hypothetical protein DHS20C18_54750 [Saprospiraceae bacterium]|nr:MAG: hypothetical protein DHS20C18_54750 [Saprospiraceae bacterium]
MEDEKEYQKSLQIDYEVEWLLKYDNISIKREYKLPSELVVLIHFLEQQDKSYKSHLDLNVSSLRGFTGLKKPTFIKKSFGVITDLDVFEWVKSYEQDIVHMYWNLESPHIISAIDENFGTTRFDLITCMLGSCFYYSNLERSKDFIHKSKLILGLEKMGRLLMEDGTIVISTLSDLENTNDFFPNLKDIMNALNKESNSFQVLEILRNDCFDIFVIGKS